MEARPNDRIRALRGPKAEIDPFEPIDVLVERERSVAGEETSITVFLAGSECPFVCVFCDLWQHTLDDPTPPGAIPRQIARAREIAGEEWPDATLKLYNASNFFDGRAVPAADDDEIAEACRGVERVVVECHPTLVGERCFEFAERLEPKLEVAMGLETVHLEALAQLNKRVTLDDFDRAVEKLAERHIASRAFVLVGTPFVPPAEQVDWTARSVEHALDRGIERISLIPVRGGNGEMERLAQEEAFFDPTLTLVEDAFDAAIALNRGVVQLDTWDLDRLTGCLRCTSRRLERLARLNATGQTEARIGCPICAGLR